MQRAVFHLLPHDVLYDLFVLAASDVQDTNPYFATTASHVCASWRATALATPPIWKNICLQARSDSAKNLEAKLYLTRATGMKVTVVIEVHAVDRPFSCPLVLPELLNGNQIYYLRLVVRERAQASVFMGFLARLGAKMAVTSFGLVVHSEMMFEITREGNGPLSTPAWCLEQSRFLWHQWDTSDITSLIIQGLDEVPSLECMRDALIGCQWTLNIFDFSSCTPTSSSSTPLEPVFLPALSFLRLAYESEISGLARLFHAPNLIVLDLTDEIATDYPGESAGTDERLLLEILLPSCHTVSVLSLTGLVGCALETVDIFYQHLPHLRTLVLRSTGPEYEDALFQADARYDGAALVFPELESLRTRIRARSGSRCFCLDTEPSKRCLRCITSTCRPGTGRRHTHRMSPRFP